MPKITVSSFAGTGLDWNNDRAPRPPRRRDPDTGFLPLPPRAWQNSETGAFNEVTTAVVPRA